MTNPLQSYILNLLGENGQGNGATIFTTGPPGGGNMFFASPSLSSSRPTAVNTSAGSPTNGGRTGHVYSGGLPPMAWIQREQQRSSSAFSPADPQRRVPVSLSSSSAEQRAEQLRAEGNNLFKEEKYEQAVAAYTRAIEADPSFVATYTNRSLAYFKLDKFDESQKDAEEAIKIKPEFYKGHYRRALALLAKGQFTLCLESLRQALTLAPPQNKEDILIMIQKCESKMVRAGTPLIAGSDVSFSSAQHRHTATASENMSCNEEEPLNFTELAEKAKETEAFRSLVDAYERQVPEESNLLRLDSCVSKVKQLLAIATGGRMEQLRKETEERQEELRKALKTQDRRAYHEAKKNRDEKHAELWKTASEVDDAVDQLVKIAEMVHSSPVRKEEPSGDMSPTASEICAGQAGEGKSPTMEARDDQSLTKDAESESEGGGKDGALSPTTRLKSLLRRRNEIAEEIRRVRHCAERTDCAARSFRAALHEEERAAERLKQLLQSSQHLGEELQMTASKVKQNTQRDLSESRINALELVHAEAQRVKADEQSFRETLLEGEKLLEEEAQLERMRLLQERQRIQLHADVEWAKVRDETESKISSMQNQLKVMSDQIAETNEKQKEIQRKIMNLVERDHPELAWKSIVSGSRILRLVKGSGLWLNVSFSDFQIVATLSSTVNSKVYHATRRGEHVALKEVPVDDEVARRRFHREVSIVASCTHPNVIRILGVFFDGPFAYIILPFYPKGSVKNLFSAKTPLSWVAVQDMLRQATSGIAYLHEHGIVHADIKPSNLLVTNEGQVVITDFGIARNNGTFGEQVDVTLTQTNSNAVSGTLQYMAPELLLQGPKETRHTATCMSDIWALGMTFCEWAMHNAAIDNPSLPKVELPVLMPSEPCVHVDPKLIGGDPKLADMLSSALSRNPARRPGAYTLLGYPYFTSLLNISNLSSDLSLSDERLEAVRSYIHAVRQGNDSKVLVSVSRNQMVESLGQIFASLDSDEVLRPIMVVFQGEAGIDEGALTSEMLNIFYEQLVKDKKALVTAKHPLEESEEAMEAHGGIIAGATYLPAEDSSGVPVQIFELMGKVLIKNIAENRPLPLQLNTSVLKYFCDVAPSILDLQEYDSAMVESLKRLRLLSSEDMEASALDFSHFTEKFLNAQRNGKYDVHTAVTADNVGDYVELRVLYDLVEVRRNNLDAIKKGLYSIHSLSSHLKLLMPSDLLLLLCGAQHISVEVVIAALDFQGFSTSSHTPADLKSVIREMSQNNLRRFLQLCTASAGVPSGGTLKKIKVICCADTNRLPVGHGCVNQLDLPDYNNKKVLEEKLGVSLAHVSDGFHIV